MIGNILNCVLGVFLFLVQHRLAFFTQKNYFSSKLLRLMISSPSDPLYLSNEGFHFKAVLVSDFVLTLSLRERGIVYLSKQKCLLEMLSPICDK